MVNDIYQIFNTTILEVNIIVPVTPKFTDKKTATKQSEMTWLINKNIYKFKFRV